MAHSNLPLAGSAIRSHLMIVPFLCMHLRQTATVMMASPGMLSRNSSTTTLGAGYGLGLTTGSPGPQSTGAGALSGMWCMR